MMTPKVNAAIAYVADFFASDASGHDAAHTMRVYRTAVRLAEEEHADIERTALIALLHDVDDVKLSPDTAADKRNARTFLASQGVSPETVDAIVTAIGEISFVGTDSVVPSTPEGRCAQDADRLDALGAIGIARTFAYGGAHGRALYDPDDPPCLNMDEAAYRARKSSSLNHFYEKLFLLKDMMTTATGRRFAEARDRRMHEFVDHFLAEWDGEE